jgi:uncharacterized protein YcgI (DUF1989 family)
MDDTSGGIHDTLIAACDRYRYAFLVEDYHDNCTDNLFAGMGELGSCRRKCRARSTCS